MKTCIVENMSDWPIVQYSDSLKSHLSIYLHICVMCALFFYSIFHFVLHILYIPQLHRNNTRKANHQNDHVPQPYTNRCWVSRALHAAFHFDFHMDDIGISAPISSWRAERVTNVIKSISNWTLDQSKISIFISMRLGIVCQVNIQCTFGDVSSPFGGSDWMRHTAPFGAFRIIRSPALQDYAWRLVSCEGICETFRGGVVWLEIASNCEN